MDMKDESVELVLVIEQALAHYEKPYAKVKTQTLSSQSNMEHMQAQLLLENEQLKRDLHKEIQKNYQ